MRPTELTRTIDFPLDESRRAELGDKIGDAYGRIAELEGALEDLKAQEKTVKGSIDQVYGEARDYAGILRKGSEPRPVEFEVRYDEPEPGKKTLVPKDGTVMDSIVEDMAPEEAQMPLGIELDRRDAADPMNDETLRIPENTDERE